MAYREPSSIHWARTPESWEYPRIRDTVETLGQLAHLWDKQGLLMLHQDGVEDSHPMSSSASSTVTKQQTGTDR